MISALLSVGMLSGAAVTILKVQTIIQTASSSNEILVDASQLRNIVELVLSNERNCKASFSDNLFQTGPTNWNKKNIDEDDMRNDTGGLAFDLKFADQDPTKESTVILSANDPKKNTIGTLKIESMKLYMPYEPYEGLGENYAQHSSGGFWDLGYFIIRGSQKISGNRTIPKSYKFPLMVNIIVNSDDQILVI